MPLVKLELEEFNKHSEMPLEICRICGSNQNSLKYVFSEGNEELVEQIRLCANIQIDALDDLPKYVCDVCEQGLAFSYNLRKKGEETEKKLRQELQSTKEYETYSLEETNENLIEDVAYDQMLITCESQDQLEHAEGLVESIEDAEEILEEIHEEGGDESEQWILQNEDYIETSEVIEDVEIEKVEEDLIELICTNGLTNETDQGENEELIGRRPRKLQIDCNTCGEVFQTRVEYCEHIKKHGDKRFHCEVCDKWFSVRYRYDQHKKNHNSEKGAFPCPKCNKTYTIRCNLERHTRSAHNGEKRFQCTECGASFGRADILKMHMAKHSNERNIECEICQKKFKTSQHLHYHKKSHLDKSERPKKPVRLKPKIKPKIQEYLCTVCDKISLHRTTHLNHMRTHTGEKPFKCATCGKAFRTTHARSNHMLLHTNERPHKCKLCDISFRQTAHLKSHMLIHTGVKRHVCEYCKKAFTMKSNLMVHYRMHTGEMPYKCNSCPQKFLQLSQFKRHKMSHMGQDEQQKETCSGNENELAEDFTESQINLYKLDRQLPQVDRTPGVSPEWGSGWKGPDFIVEVEETALDTGIRHTDPALNSTNLTEEGPKIIVRTEEVLIVGLVLMLWVGAIVLFFNRWGKIRMLEPYQPKFQQQHRSSCPLVDLDSLQSHPRASVSRMSMGMTGQLNIPACKFATYSPTIYTPGYTTYTRPRQNSVFVGPQVLLPKPPRKTRSAMDIHSMVLDESAEHV